MPFTLDKHETTVRAVIQDARSIELHGNPTDPVNESLCFRQFSWGTRRQLTEACFAEVRVYTYHSREMCCPGCFQKLISAVRI